MKVVYVAGPFRAPTPWAVEQNCRRAEEVALMLWRSGFVALCPHLNARNFEGACPDETWLAGGLELLRRSDAVVLVEGWERSSGTLAEIREAFARRVPVYSSAYAIWGAVEEGDDLVSLLAADVRPDNLAALIAGAAP